MYDQKYNGQYYQMVGGITYELRPNGSFGGNGIQEVMVRVQTTGYYRISTLSGDVMLQTTSGEYIDPTEGWNNVGYSPLRSYSQKDADFYLKKIIKNNARILENNLLCARFVDKLSEREKSDLYVLQLSLESRNSSLINDGYIQDAKASYPPGYSLLNNQLQSFMQTYGTSPVSGVGVVISTGTIIVSAIVIASLATAAYFAFKAMYRESEEDVKYSDELTQTLLAKLTPEEYEALMRETQGIVTKAKLFARFSNVTGIIKWGLIGFAGYTIYRTIKDRFVR